MPRAKKDCRNLNIKLATETYDLFDKFCDETGITKTTATEKILNHVVAALFSLRLYQFEMRFFIFRFKTGELDLQISDLFVQDLIPRYTGE